MNNEKFGLFIKECRIKHNYTQQELADLLGVTNKAVSKWERALSIPDITMFVPIAKHLNVSVVDLLSAGDLMEKENIEKKEVGTMVETVLEISNQGNKEKINKILFILAIALLWIGIGVTLFINFILNHELTWSLVTSVPQFGVMLGLTIIYYDHSDIKQKVMKLGLLTLAFIITLFISIAYVINDYSWIMQLAIPTTLLAFICLLFSYVFIIKSKVHWLIKTHVCLLFTDIVMSVGLMFLLQENGLSLPNAIIMGVLIILLPISFILSKIQINNR